MQPNDADFALVPDEKCIFSKAVQRNGIIVGYLSRWCCGTDFRLAHKDGHFKNRPLFSILKLKPDDIRILDCINEIMQLDLSSLSGHYNYQHPDYRTQTWEEVKGKFDEIAKNAGK